MANQTDNVNLNITIDASNAQKNTDNLRGRIKELTKQMAQLRLEGKENSAQYKQMAQEVGRLKDTLGDVAAETRALADDNQTLTATMQGMSTGVAVFTGLQSAAAMLGVEDKNLLEVLTKLQAAQVLLNSVNTIAKNLNRDSALMIALRSKNTKALTADIKAETSATVAGTSATKTFTAAEATATAGAKGLKGAVKAVGTAIKNIPVVGWILAAIAAVTTLISLIKDANDEEQRGVNLANERLKILNQVQELEYGRYLSQKDEEAHWKDVLDKLHNAKEGTQEYVDLVQQLASYTSISADYLQKHPKLIDAIVNAQIKANNAQDAYKNNLADINNGAINQQKLMNEQSELQLKEAQGLTDEEQKRLDSLKDQIKASQENQELLTSQTDGLKKQADAAQQIVYQYRNIAKANADVTNARIEAKNKADKLEKEAAERARKIEETRLKLLKLLHKDNLDYQQGIVDSYKKEGDLANEYLENLKLAETEVIYKFQELNEEFKKNEKNLKDEFKTLTDETGKLIEPYRVLITEFSMAEHEIAMEYSGRLKEMEDEFFKNSIDLEKKELDSIMELEKSKSDARIASAKEGSEEYFEALKERNTIEQSIELQNINYLFDQKLISEELYESEVDRIKAEHTKEREKIEKDSLQAIQEERNNVMDSFATVASQTSALITDMMETELEGVEQGSKKEKQIRKKYAVAEATMQIADIGISTAQSIMGAWESTSKLVYPLNLIMGGIMTAMLAMTGLAQTAKAMKSKQEIMKASKGMYISGRSHANGGELIEAEGGEVIMSKRAVSAYGGLLSQLNSSVGGVRFPQAENNGRGVMQTTINPNDLRTIVTEVVAGTSAIPVVVSERDISTSQARAVSISSYARI